MRMIRTSIFLSIVGGLLIWLSSVMNPGAFILADRPDQVRVEIGLPWLIGIVGVFMLTSGLVLFFSENRKKVPARHSLHQIHVQQERQKLLERVNKDLKLAS